MTMKQLAVLVEPLGRLHSMGFQRAVDRRLLAEVNAAVLAERHMEQSAGAGSSLETHHRIDGRALSAVGRPRAAGCACAIAHSW